MLQQFDKSILIKKPASTIWHAITNPESMKEWMADPEVEAEVITDWKVGSPIVIKGFHHIRFENKGSILQCIPEKLLQYNFVSPLSKLPPIPENHTIVTFTLTALNETTAVTLTLQNFPTEAIFKHLDFYWSGTLAIMKNVIEAKP